MISRGLLSDDVISTHSRLFYEDYKQRSELIHAWKTAKMGFILYLSYESLYTCHAFRFRFSMLMQTWTLCQKKRRKETFSDCWTCFSISIFFLLRQEVRKASYGCNQYLKRLMEQHSLLNSTYMRETFSCSLTYAAHPMLCIYLLGKRILEVLWDNLQMHLRQHIFHNKFNPMDTYTEYF